MSHISMSHVTHINQSCHTYEWVMSHISISHVTCINGSCHTGVYVAHTYTYICTCKALLVCAFDDMSHLWVMSHTSIGHVTHINRSCHTCQWVMSHIWLSHVIQARIFNTFGPRMNPADGRVVSNFIVQVSATCVYVTFTCVTWLVHMVMSHVGFNFIVQVCTTCVWRDVRAWGVTHPYGYGLCHFKLHRLVLCIMCVTWRRCVWGSCTFAPWLIRMYTGHSISDYRKREPERERERMILRKCKKS